jgi:hypothetical protein
MRTLRGRVLPGLMVLIGVALIVKSILSLAVLGIILGVLFIGAGAGRLYLEEKL